MEIKGCVAVVTGGASGLGDACVRDLAGLGAKVCIMDINAERGEGFHLLNGATIRLDGALRMAAR